MGDSVVIYQLTAEAEQLMVARYFANDSMAQIVKAIREQTGCEISRSAVALRIYRKNLRREGSTFRPMGRSKKPLTVPNRTFTPPLNKTTGYGKAHPEPPIRAPGPNSRLLMDLKNGCAFPVGRATGADQLFCGERKSQAKPYCERCMKRAFHKWR